MIQYIEGADDQNLEYPFKKKTIENLGPSTLVNPKVGKSHGIVLPEEYKTEDGLMEMAQEVDRAVNLASRGKFDADGFAKYWPEVWGAFDDTQIPAFKAKGMRNSRPITLAQNVRMDKAAEFYNVMHDWVMMSGYRMKDAPENWVDFLGHNFDDAAEVMAKTAKQMHKCFETKSHFAVPRPQKVLGANMTLYDEGAPHHGEFLSGHTTAAFKQVMCLMDRFKFDRDGVLMLLRMAWHIANSRTIAGVHYYQTNYMTAKWVIEDHGRTIEGIFEGVGV